VSTLVRESVEIFAGDVRDADRVVQAIHGCSYAFHLASLVGIPYSYEAPRSYVDTNVGGTLNVLEACRQADRFIRLVHTSTSEVYGTAKTAPIAETHPLVGQSPYSATKIAADKLAESFHLSFGLPVVIARPFNTFGPRQTARAVIPTIASQLLAGAKELKLGALWPTRDFNYVTDTAAGLIALACCKAAVGEVINIGTGEEWSIETIAKMLMQTTGRQVPIIGDDTRLRPARSEVDRLLADASKLATLTGWQPRVTMPEGLARTCAWIGRNLSEFELPRYAR
jgi:NAD dependent epimerase/dehydratase